MSINKSYEFAAKVLPVGQLSKAIKAGLEKTGIQWQITSITINKILDENTSRESEGCELHFLDDVCDFTLYQDISISLDSNIKSIYIVNSYFGDACMYVSSKSSNVVDDFIEGFKSISKLKESSTKHINTESDGSNENNENFTSVPLRTN